MHTKRLIIAPLVLVLTASLFVVATANAGQSCLGRKASIIGTPGSDTIRGTRAPDVIATMGGDDTVISKDGRDVICTGRGSDLVKAGPSRDKVSTGTGDDRVVGGSGLDTVNLGSGMDWISGDEGSDRIFAGSGDDTIIGRTGGETVHAGPGTDRILGGLLDDHLYGGTGDDIILGGHGGDSIRGEAGNDLMRGGVNYDFYAGGEGYDTISFAAAMPPGPNGVSGITISPEWMSGDDLSGETRSSVERYVGSAFEDEFSAEGDFLDLCGGSDCTDSAGSVALLDTRIPEDVGLLALGDSSNDDFTISQKGRTLRVSHSSPMASGGGCQDVTETLIECTLPSDGALGFIAASGAAGRDEIDLGSGIADEITVDIDSGTGNDSISGGPGDDVLIDEGGEDLQQGEAGSDALLSTTGADRLLAGSGSDQLVTDTLCFAHVFDGGAGMGDIAGFARVRNRGISGGFGRGVVARDNPDCPRIDVRMSNEIFEGTNQSDVMYGTSRDDYILSREGDDVLRGLAGDDSLDGQENFDRCFGGSGADSYSACEVKR